MMVATRELLEALRMLAKDAAAAILTVYEQDFDVTRKDDRSPLTAADLASHRILVDGLHALTPEIPVLSEECADLDVTERRGWARYWCVDPLDGTRGFAKGGDEFTVNIALVEDGSPTIGVIYAPATGELYAGEPGKALAGKCDPQTAQLLELMKLISINAALPPQPRVVASDFSGRNERTGEFIKALNGVITHASSSIKFCRVAEGAADFYPRFGDVSEWDAAAGHAILKAAGGDIMLLDGSPLRYGGKNGDFLIHGFVAYSSDIAKAAALAALTR